MYLLSGRITATPVLIHGPDSVTVHEGTPASFTCTWNDHFHVGWRMSPHVLTHSVSTNGTSTTLTVTSVSVHHNETEIWCMASSGNGTFESNTAILLVLGMSVVISTMSMLISETTIYFSGAKRYSYTHNHARSKINTIPFQHQWYCTNTHRYVHTSACTGHQSCSVNVWYYTYMYIQ